MTPHLRTVTATTPTIVFVVFFVIVVAADGTRRRHEALCKSLLGVFAEDELGVRRQHGQARVRLFIAFERVANQHLARWEGRQAVRAGHWGGRRRRR